jgi:TM2 domain-containing membrane protein YozV
MSSNPPGSSFNPPPASGGGGGAIIPPTTPPKDPILIAVLNLLVAGGVGYIIIGQKMKGIVAIVAWVILIFVTCGIGSGILSIVTALDGYFQALELQAGRSVGEWTFFKDHR